MDIHRLILDRAALNAEISEKERALKGLKEELGELDRKLIDWLEASGAKAFSIDEGPTISINTRPKASIPRDLEGEWHKYLKENGFGHVVKESVHHATQNALIADFLEEGTAIPDYVTVYWDKKLSFRSNGYGG